MDWWLLFWNERVVAALVTALVGGGVVAAGWFWTHALSRRRDLLLRGERINDILRALLAEIRAHVVALEGQQAELGSLPYLGQVGDEDYLPILPHDANDRIFRAIVEEVHVLPGWAIDPIVRYYRLVAVRAALAQDIRNNAKEYPRRTAEMFRDYLVLNEETRDAGHEAMLVLGSGLQGGEAAVNAMYDESEKLEAERIAATLPDELAAMRSRLNKRSSDRSGL